MSRLLFIFTLVLAACLALVVSAMNPQRIDIELALLRFEAPLGLVLVCVFALGLVAGLAWRGYWLLQLLNERGRLRRALRLAESKARSSAAAGEDAA